MISERNVVKFKPSDFLINLINSNIADKDEIKWCIKENWRGLSAIKYPNLRYKILGKKFSPLNPIKKPNGIRYYDESQLKLLEKIKSLLYDQKFSIEGAKIFWKWNKKQRWRKNYFWD